MKPVDPQGDEKQCLLCAVTLRQHTGGSGQLKALEENTSAQHVRKTVELQALGDEKPCLLCAVPSSEHTGGGGQLKALQKAPAVVKHGQLLDCRGTSSHACCVRVTLGEHTGGGGQLKALQEHKQQSNTESRYITRRRAAMLAVGPTVCLSTSVSTLEGVASSKPCRKPRQEQGDEKPCCCENVAAL
jgi:hypothetical protein